MSKQIMKPIKGIACVASNGAIGYKGDLIWRCKEDMKFFKKTTLTTTDSNKHNAVIMGRETYKSVTFLKGRFNCVLSSTLPSIRVKSDLLIHSDLEYILEVLRKDDSIENIFIIGGTRLYKYFIHWGLFDEIYLSHISCEIDHGDTFFPEILDSEYSYQLVSELKNISARQLNVSETPIKVNYTVFKLVNKHRYDIDSDGILNVTATKTSSGKDNKITNDSNSVIKIQHFKNILTSVVPKPSSPKLSQEYQYLDLMRDVLYKGERRMSRNAETISLFGVKMTFDISKSFPLLTTKRMYWKGILHELLWFIKAKTNSKELEDVGVNIWRGNSTREYLDSIGLNHYKEGECGPIYGFQWRHFNAKYIDSDTDYTGQGVDQLQNIINLIKTNPKSRRMYMTGWNPCQLPEMALPPCHISYQFYVRESSDNTYLDCMMYQRSGDVFLGVPFNIGSTATLTYIIAKLTGILPGKITIVIGDAHIYASHTEQVEKQLARTPKAFPTLSFTRDINDINDLKYADFKLEHYKCHPSIRADMVP